MRAMARLAVAALVLAGCVRTYTTSVVEVAADGLRREEPLRSASNLPASFQVVTAAATASDCPAALRDPALNATLTLRRSLLLPVRDSSGTSYVALGDYAVSPAGLYGDAEGDGLRLDCTRMRALGVVRLVGA
jgi:hypothetical protein